MQYKINIQTNWSRPNGHPQTMKMANPPLPPFRKGGMGGFENYFQCKTKTMLMKGLRLQVTEITIKYNLKYNLLNY